MSTPTIPAQTDKDKAGDFALPDNWVDLMLEKMKTNSQQPEEPKAIQPPPPRRPGHLGRGCPDDDD
jgi:hypothetical protein